MMHTEVDVVGKSNWTFVFPATSATSVLFSCPCTLTLSSPVWEKALQITNSGVDLRIFMNVGDPDVIGCLQEAK